MQWQGRKWANSEQHRFLGRHAPKLLKLHQTKACNNKHHCTLTPICVREFDCDSLANDGRTSAIAAQTPTATSTRATTVRQASVTCLEHKMPSKEHSLASSSGLAIGLCLFTGMLWHLAVRSGKRRPLCPNRISGISSRRPHLFGSLHSPWPWPRMIPSPLRRPASRLPTPCCWEEGGLLIECRLRCPSSPLPLPRCIRGSWLRGCRLHCLSSPPSPPWRQQRPRPSAAQLFEGWHWSQQLPWPLPSAVPWPAPLTLPASVTASGVQKMRGLEAAAAPMWLRILAASPPPH
mmetsp:Transcript_102190/g.256185  ORF Transcript_102190/g.256185 Transcript_102190/m.256185 type:complete len:291 (+) Transcript_102190:146-1018(+)